ncbi:hypothetical protein LguiB_034167 [Lonicera macranthoides]
MEMKSPDREMPFLSKGKREKDLYISIFFHEKLVNQMCNLVRWFSSFSYFP